MIPHFRNSLPRPSAWISLLALACLAPGCGGPDGDSNASWGVQIEEGINALRMFDFERSYNTLSPIHSELETGTEDWVKATYTLALASWHKTPPSEASIDRAASLLQSLVEVAPDSQFAANALLDLGRIAEISDYRNDEPDLELARNYYERVRSEYPDSDASVRATLYLAQSLAQTFDPEATERAVALLQETLAAHPDSDWVGLVGQYTAYLLAFYLDDKAAALEPYQTAVAAGLPRRAQADISLWQLGNLAEDADRPMIAVEAFSKIVEDYPRSIYGNIARNRVIAIAKQHPEAGITIPDLSDIDLGR